MNIENSEFYLRGSELEILESYAGGSCKIAYSTDTKCLFISDNTRWFKVPMNDVGDPQKTYSSTSSSSNSSDSSSSSSSQTFLEVNKNDTINVPRDVENLRLNLDSGDQASLIFKIGAYDYLVNAANIDGKFVFDYGNSHGVQYVFNDPPETYEFLLGGQTNSIEFTAFGSFIINIKISAFGEFCISGGLKGTNGCYSWDPTWGAYANHITGARIYKGLDRWYIDSRDGTNLFSFLDDGSQNPSQNVHLRTGVGIVTCEDPLCRQSSHSSVSSNSSESSKSSSSSSSSSQSSSSQSSSSLSSSSKSSSSLSSSSLSSSQLSSSSMSSSKSAIVENLILMVEAGALDKMVANSILNQFGYAPMFSSSSSNSSNALTSAIDAVNKMVADGIIDQSAADLIIIQLNGGSSTSSTSSSETAGSGTTTNQASTGDNTIDLSVGQANSFSVGDNMLIDGELVTVTNVNTITGEITFTPPLTKDIPPGVVVQQVYTSSESSLSSSTLSSLSSRSSISSSMSSSSVSSSKSSASSSSDSSSRSSNSSSHSSSSKTVQDALGLDLATGWATTQGSYTLNPSPSTGTWSTEYFFTSGGLDLILKWDPGRGEFDLIDANTGVTIQGIITSLEPLQTKTGYFFQNIVKNQNNEVVSFDINYRQFGTPNYTISSTSSSTSSISSSNSSSSVSSNSSSSLSSSVSSSSVSSNSSSSISSSVSSSSRSSNSSSRSSSSLSSSVSSSSVSSNSSSSISSSVSSSSRSSSSSQSSSSSSSQSSSSSSNSSSSATTYVVQSINSTSNFWPGNEVNLQGYDNFGKVVSMSGDGTTVAVAAPDWESNTFAINLAGVDQYTKLSTPLSFNGAYTFSIWFYPEGDATTASDEMFIIPANTSTGYISWYGPIYGNKLIIRNNNGHYTGSAQSIVAGQWYHLLITRDSQNNQTYYVDGVALYNNTQSGTIHFDDFGKGTNTNTYWIGELDEIAFYTHHLSASEVAEVYNNGSVRDLTTISSAGKMANYYRMGDMDDSTGTTITDRKGTNNLSLENGASFSSAKAPWNESRLLLFKAYSETNAAYYSSFGELKLWEKEQLPAGGGDDRGPVLIATIDGSQDFNAEHISLSTDGQTVAVGSGSYAGAGNSRGRIQVYRWAVPQDTKPVPVNTANYVQIGQDIEGETDFDYLGKVNSFELSSDGNILIAGQYGDDTSDTTGGAVRTFDYNSSTDSWVEREKIISPISQNYSNFGYSVDISEDGSVIAVGQPGYRTAGSASNAGEGKVHVYDQHPLETAVEFGDGLVSSSGTTRNRCAVDFGTSVWNSNFTVSGWFKKKHGSMNVLAEGTSVDDYGDGWRLYAVGNLRLWSGGSTVTTGNLVTSSNSFSTTDWNHFAFVRGTNSLSIFLNGVKTEVMTTGSNWSKSDFAIGDTLNGSTMTLDGLLSNYAIFDSELSDSDITRIYNNGFPNDISNFSNLFAYYPMDDATSGDVSTITDTTGNGYNLQTTLELNTKPQFVDARSWIPVGDSIEGRSYSSGSTGDYIRTYAGHVVRLSTARTDGSKVVTFTEEHGGTSNGGAVRQFINYSSTCVDFSNPNANNTAQVDNNAYGTISNLEMNGAFTISMWFNANSNMSGSGGPASHPLFHKNYVSTDTTDITFDIGNGRLRTSVYDRSATWGNGSNMSTQVGFQPAIGQWYHIMFTYDGTTSSDSSKIFVDGVEQVVAPQFNDVGVNFTSMQSPADTVAYIGDAHLSNGRIDAKVKNLAIWNSDQRDNIDLIYGGSAYLVQPDHLFKLDGDTNNSTGTATLDINDASFVVDSQNWEERGTPWDSYLHDDYEGKGLAVSADGNKYISGSPGYDASYYGEDGLLSYRIWGSSNFYTPSFITGQYYDELGLSVSADRNATYFIAGSNWDFANIYKYGIGDEVYSSSSSSSSSSVSSISSSSSYEYWAANNVAVKFNGSNQYGLASTAHDPLKTSYGGYSVSAWVKITTFANGVAVYSLDAGQFGGSWTKSTFLRINSSTSVSWYHSSQSTYAGLSYSNINLQQGRWYHFAQVWAGSNVKLYLDGVLHNTASINGVGWGDASNGSSPADERVKFNLGRGRMGYYPCEIADFAFFGRALSDGGVADTEIASGEIATVYNNRAMYDYSLMNINDRPDHWYRMGEDNGSAGSTISDVGWKHSQHGYHHKKDLTLFNNPEFTSGPANLISSHSSQSSDSSSHSSQSSDSSSSNSSLSSSADSLWSPNVLSTKLWLDASDLSTITESLGVVTQWSDKSGNNNHMTASGNPITTPGNTIDLDGNDAFEKLNFAVPASGNLQVFIVCDVQQVDNSADAILSMNATNNDFQIDSGTASAMSGRIQGTGIGSGSTGIGWSSVIGAHIWNATFDFTSGNYSLKRDGLRVPGTALANYTTKLNQSLDLRIFLNRAISEFPKGEVSEVVILEDVSDPTKEKIEGYLAHKWGLEAFLPSNHPYISAPPASQSTQNSSSSISSSKSSSSKSSNSSSSSSSDPAGGGSGTTPSQYTDAEALIQGTTSPLIVGLNRVQTLNDSGNLVNGVEFKVLDTRATTNGRLFNVSHANNSGSGWWYGMGAVDADGYQNFNGDTIGNWTQEGSLYTFSIAVDSSQTSGNTRFKVLLQESGFMGSVVGVSSDDASNGNNGANNADYPWINVDSTDANLNRWDLAPQAQAFQRGNAVIGGYQGQEKGVVVGAFPPAPLSLQVQYPSDTSSEWQYSVVWAGCQDGGASESSLSVDGTFTYTDPNACYDTSQIATSTFSVGQYVTYNSNNAVILKVLPWNTYDLQDLDNNSYHVEISAGAIS